MNQAIMGQKIQQTVRSHSGADPFQWMRTLSAHGNQHNGEQRENQRIKVVLFEPAAAWFMVRAVPAPAPAMHHVAMCEVREPFHANQGREENQCIE
ncbi:hypothetical protein AUC61_17795 [Pseudomonas sp. S25]|uniref:Uncharacterized protein n=1 Tax=Pseudomonas maioricensis TaxID=1766623 RepID=A0ABS9ZLB4_9PSED|nr:hypothetical protein [Pseudomonas sp. S25]